MTSCLRQVASNDGTSGTAAQVTGVIAWALGAAGLVLGCGGTTPGSVEALVEAGSAGAGGRTSEGAGGSSSGGASGGGESDAGAAPVPDASVACPDESCEALAASLDARWPASDRVAGATMEACCFRGSCGGQWSTVRSCLPAAGLESLVDSLVASHLDPLADAVAPWDGAAPKCPVETPGARVAGEACGPCLPQGTPCTRYFDLTGPTAAQCADMYSTDPNLQCLWYPDGYDVDLPWGVQFWCLSNPGRVVCGGGL